MHDTTGIDISKDTFDIHRLSDRRHERFDSDKAGLAALRRWIGKTPVRIVHEATGRYHRDLEEVMGHAGHALVKVNPTRAPFCPSHQPGCQDRPRRCGHSGADGSGARPRRQARAKRKHA